MTGEVNLHILLRDMNPCPLPEEYVFCTLGNESDTDFSRLSPLAYFREQEGISLVLTRNEADAAKLPYNGSFGGILIQVHSSLHAVGLTAAIASALTEESISANIIAAYHHDHVFVPIHQLDQALATLKTLSAKAHTN